MSFTPLPHIKVAESLAPWLSWVDERLDKRDALRSTRFLLAENNQAYMLWQFAVTFDHTNKVVRTLESIIDQHKPAGDGMMLKEALLCSIDTDSNDAEFLMRTYLDEHCYKTFYILKGAGTFTVNDETIAYSAGDSFMLPPMQAKALATSVVFERVIAAVCFWGTFKEPVYNLITMRRFGRVYIDPLEAPTVQQKE